MGPLGWQETLFIFILALLLFGPKKLPELGKTIGKAVSEFRRASAELKSTFDREMSAIERENESLKEVTSGYNPEDYSYNYNYDSSSYGSEYSSSESTDSTATSTSTASASATEGAESPAVAPEGTVASGTLAAAVAESNGGQPEAAQPTSTEQAGGHPAAESQTVKS